MPSGLLDPSTACPLYSQALPCSPRPSHPVVKLSSSSCTIPLAQKHSRPPHAHLHLFPHDTHHCLSRTHVFLLAASNLTFLGLSALWAILSLRNDPLGPPLRVPTSLLLLFLRIYRLSLFFFYHITVPHSLQALHVGRAPRPASTRNPSSVLFPHKPTPSPENQSSPCLLHLSPNL